MSLKAWNGFRTMRTRPGVPMEVEPQEKRYCSCGTVLAKSNIDDLCWQCKHKQRQSIELDPFWIELTRNADWQGRERVADLIAGKRELKW